MTHYDNIMQFSRALRLACGSMCAVPQFQAHHIDLRAHELIIHPPVTDLFPPGLGRTEIRISFAYIRESNGVDVIVSAHGKFDQIAPVLAFFNRHLEGVPV